MMLTLDRAKIAKGLTLDLGSKLLKFFKGRYTIKMGRKKEKGYNPRFQF